MSTPITIFYSYAQSKQDEILRAQLEAHLKVLEHSGLITGWYKQEVGAGQEWAKVVDEHLDAAQIVLLLISPDFLASPYCYGVEMRRALERHQRGEARVIPILLRPVFYEGAPFAHLRALPGNGKPIIRWTRRDDAFIDIARELNRVLQELSSLSPSHLSSGIPEELIGKTPVSESPQDVVTGDISKAANGSYRVQEAQMGTFLKTNWEQGTKDLIQEMEQAKLIQPDEALQTIQKRLESFPRLFTDGLCRGLVLRPAPHEYFVSHGFPPETLVDWRRSLTDAMAQASHASKPLAPYVHGDTLGGGYRLCSICEKLYATRFSIFLLPPSQDRNVYLELGIALGLDAPFLLIQPRGTEIPPVLMGLNRYITNGTLRTLRQELPGQVGKIEEYNFGIIRVSRSSSSAKRQLTYVIAAGNLVDDPDLEDALTTAIQSNYPHIEVLSLTQLVEASGGTWMLDQLIDTIKQTQLVIYRVNENSSPMTFLALGISIVLNRPFLMIKDTRSDVPIDLRGIGIYQFPNFTTLEKDFVALHQDFWFSRKSLPQADS